jgi:hypothetical protein
MKKDIFLWRNRMNSLAYKIKEAQAHKVSFSDDSLKIELNDGHTIIAPLVWYPRLWHGSQEERETYQINGNGEYIHWPELDEDLTVSGVLAGYRSIESATSLEKWLKARATNVLLKMKQSSA